MWVQQSEAGRRHAYNRRQRRLNKLEISTLVPGNGTESADRVTLHHASSVSRYTPLALINFMEAGTMG